MWDGYVEWVWGVYGSGDEARNLYDSGDWNFDGIECSGDCGDDKGSDHGHGGVDSVCEGSAVASGT